MAETILKNILMPVSNISIFYNFVLVVPHNVATAEACKVILPAIYGQEFKLPTYCLCVLTDYLAIWAEQVFQILFFHVRSWQIPNKNPSFQISRIVTAAGA